MRKLFRVPLLVVLALGIIAVMLIVGSFWGRAGGLIALGLVAALVTAAATASAACQAPARLTRSPGQEPITA